MAKIKEMRSNCLSGMDALIISLRVGKLNPIEYVVRGCC